METFGHTVVTFLDLLSRSSSEEIRKTTSRILQLCTHIYPKNIDLPTLESSFCFERFESLDRTFSPNSSAIELVNE